MSKRVQHEWYVSSDGVFYCRCCGVTATSKTVNMVSQQACIWPPEKTVVGEFKPEVEKALAERGRRLNFGDTLTPAELYYEVLMLGCPEVHSTHHEVFEKVVKVVVEDGVKFLQYTDFQPHDELTILPDLSAVCFVVPIEKTINVYEVEVHDGN